MADADPRGVRGRGHDPSGYFLKKALKIGVTIAASYYPGGWAAGVLNSAAAGAAIGGAVGGYLNTGARMWAPYYTLENTPKDRPWRDFYAVVTLGVLGATCYWLIKDWLS